jgi:hypothetical protein
MSWSSLLQSWLSLDSGHRTTADRSFLLGLWTRCVMSCSNNNSTGRQQALACPSSCPCGVTLSPRQHGWHLTLSCSFLLTATAFCVQIPGLRLHKPQCQAWALTGGLSFQKKKKKPSNLHYQTERSVGMCWGKTSFTEAYINLQCSNTGLLLWVELHLLIKGVQSIWAGFEQRGAGSTVPLLRSLAPRKEKGLVWI